MSSAELEKQVERILHAITEDGIDPLEFHLTPAFKELQALMAQLDTRINIDEMLNDVLYAKVTRVQELARILGAPELYVARLKEVKSRSLGKMIVYRQPVKLTRLEYTTLSEALERVVRHIDALEKESPEDPVPKMSGLPDGFKFQSEDSVFLEDLEKFLKSIKKGKSISIDEAVRSKDFEEALKKFLYVVVLISRGSLKYFPKTRELLKE
jgi:hypothetical protein